MRKSTKTGIAFSLALLILSCSSARPQLDFQDVEDADQNWLVLSTEISKSALRLGDRLEIKYRMTNVSDRPIRIHRDPHKFVRLTSMKGEVCPIVNGAQVMEGEFVRLSPGQTLQDQMAGTLEEGIAQLPKGKEKADGYEQVQGLLLAFPTYKLFLKPGQGKYRFQPLYHTRLWEHRSNYHHIQIMK